jgi:O-antigen/teichoic acid export membrane protein
MSLRRNAMVAVASGGVLSLVSDVVRLGVMMAMTRLLTPDDYGNFALAFSAMLWVGRRPFVLPG